MSIRDTPFHKRMSAPKAQGGPSVKHLRALAEKLCYKSAFNSDYIPKSNNQYDLANFISAHFRGDRVDEAHAELCEFYRSRNRYNRPSHSKMDTPSYPNWKDGKEPISPPDVPNYKALEDRVIAHDAKPESTNQSSDNKPQDQDGDNKYVLRKDYDEDLKTQSELFYGLEQKTNGLEKRCDDLTRVSCDTTLALGKLEEKINNIKDHRPTVIELHIPDTAPIIIGTVHKHFPLLALAANSRMRNGTRQNIWLYGPAGTGKTHAAEMLADMYFGKEYQAQAEVIERMAAFKSRFNQKWSNYNYNGALATSFQVLGYMDANGRYVPTPFRFVWEFGGVYMFDEIDGSMPDATLALNGALSGDICSFPDGMIKRHPDCIIIAGANTTGLGGGVEYVGAMKQNAAFLDRWNWIAWPHDDALEDSLCANKAWLARVRKVRENWKREQIKGHLVTMRATLKGESLLAAGIDQPIVEEMVLKCGLSDAQWKNIR